MQTVIVFQNQIFLTEGSIKMQKKKKNEKQETSYSVYAYLIRAV